MEASTLADVPDATGHVLSLSDTPSLADRSLPTVPTRPMIDDFTAVPSLQPGTAAWALFEPPSAAHTGVRLSLREAFELDPAFGAHDNCSELVITLLARLPAAAGGRHVPRRLLSRAATLELVLGRLADALPRVYALHCDQVCHALTMHTAAGAARVYQAFVVDELRTTSGRVERTGYTAAEWLRAEPQPHWAAPMVVAHARWGGERALDAAELCALLELVFALQAACAPAATALVEQLPRALQSAEADWQAQQARDDAAAGGPLPAAGASVRASRVAERSPVQRWAAAALARVDEVQFYADESGFVALRFPAPSGEEDDELVTLCVPAELHTAIDAPYAALTGQRFAGVWYLRVLEHRHWLRQVLRGPDGQAEQLGWAVQCVELGAG
jgi:hypothetical protein